MQRSTNWQGNACRASSSPVFITAENGGTQGLSAGLIVEWRHEGAAKRPMNTRQESEL
jgi:hypothetical protein